jgi:hypothetical protein
MWNLAACLPVGNIKWRYLCSPVTTSLPHPFARRKFAVACATTYEIAGQNMNSCQGVYDVDSIPRTVALL